MAICCIVRMSGKAVSSQIQGRDRISYDMNPSEKRRLQCKERASSKCQLATQLYNFYKENFPIVLIVTNIQEAAGRNHYFALCEPCLYHVTKHW